MCRDAVAAPRALQLIVYPISLKKSLLFCEKIEKIKLFFRKEIKSENCAGTKAFSDGLKMPIQDFPRTGQSFAAAGVPDSLLKGCPMQKLFFSITQQAQKVNSLSAVLRVRGRAPHSGRRCAGWPRPVRGSPA